MQQVIVIHGGSTFSNYDDYLQSLSTKDISFDRITYRPEWKEQLAENLGSSYQVLLPTMPNSANARYSEWKIWFEHIGSLFSNNCILVGHSLGAIFLAKFLSENKLSVQIKATILIAAPYDDESGEDLTDFKITAISKRFSEQAGHTVCISGTDDPVVPAQETDKYQRALPFAQFILLPAADHFVRTEFPELTTLIKDL